MPIHPIRIREAAGRYKINPYTLYRWNAKGRFPGLFMKLGKMVYLDENELRRILKQSKETPQARRMDVDSIARG